MAARPYLPVDPGQATKRIEQIYQQSGAKTILTCGEYPAAEKLGAIFLGERYSEYHESGEFSLPDNPYGTPIGCLLREAPERLKVCEFLLLHWKILLDGCCPYRLLQNVVKG